MKRLNTYLEKHPKKCLIFDLDKTLADLQIHWKGFSEGFFQFVEVSIDPNIVHQFPDKLGQEQSLYNDVIMKYGFPAKVLVDKFCQDWESQKISKIIPNESLITLIRKNDRFKYFVWTANNVTTAIQALESIGIMNRFVQVVGKETINLTKPHPDGFYAIYESSKFKREDYLLIGDSMHDELAAANAGIDFFRLKPFGNFID